VPFVQRPVEDATDDAAPADGADEIVALEDRERELEERERAVRERELAERERAVAARESAVAARETRAAQREAQQAETATEPAEAPSDSRPEAPGLPREVVADPEPQVGEVVEISSAEPAGDEIGTGPLGSETAAVGDFADAASETEPPAEPRSEKVAVTVPADTVLEIEFLTDLSSGESASGDLFEAEVVEDVEISGLVAIPRGSLVLGHVAEAVPLKKVGGHAKLVLGFDRLELPWGEKVAIDASFDQQGRSETKRDAATIAGSAAGGAVLGRILGKKKKGAILGAVLGAAIGTAVATNTPGEEVEIPRGTVVGLRLDDWVRVAVEVER
jgi:hypothetical protein